MRKREGGQAFILVLILLAIGAMLVVPAMQLTNTTLKSSQIVTRQAKALYAVDAVQEYILWKLSDIGFRTENFQYDGQTWSDNLTVCDIPVSVTVIMRAVEGAGAVILSTDDVILPTKTVFPNTVPTKTDQTYTYTITLEQLSDNTSQGLDAVYDILPKGFGNDAYETGSSEFRVDGGEWVPIAEPDQSFDEGHLVLRWPAEGNFTLPIRNFTVRQVKELRFKVRDTFQTEGVYRNWVVLKPWNTLSGATAPITVGSPSDNTSSTGMLEVDKTAFPELILPGVETPVDYTITITNLDIPTRQIQEIIDYLPPEFYYTDGSADGLTPFDPISENVSINGIDRQVLRWTESEFPSGNTTPIHSGETLNLTFQARTTKNVSGSYYNEIIILTDMDEDIRQVFENIGVSASEFGSNYSWNTGTVIVPAYDSRAEAEGMIIDANMALLLGSVSITSYQVR